jgi:hypothetical protein
MFLLSAFDGGKIEECSFALFEYFVVEAVICGGVYALARVVLVAVHFVENDVFAYWAFDIGKGVQNIAVPVCPLSTLYDFFPSAAHARHVHHALADFR